MTTEMKTLDLATRSATWANLGTDVSNSKTLDDVIRNAHLDYEVEMRDLVVAGTDFIIPDKKATVRVSDGHTYGVVSNKYSIVQNAEAFDFMNYINSDLEYVKAGETESGMIYIIGKLPEQYILGDKFTPYVIFRNSFNGRYPVQSAICPLRIVCQNQFNMAFKKSDNTINIRHSRNAEFKMKEAQEVLRLTAEHMNMLGDYAEQLASEKVSDVEVGRIIDGMFVVDENSSKRHITSMEADRASFMTAYHADDNANFVGTKYGLLNAFADFQSHRPIQRNTKTAEENRFVAVSFDPVAMTTFMNLVNSVTI